MTGGLDALVRARLLFALSRLLPALPHRKCGTVSESDEEWGGQSWLPPGFYPAFSGVLHTLKSRLERRLQDCLSHRCFHNVQICVTHYTSYS
jgi:hypothetical protein